jgi:hypothetical protein
VWSFLLNACFLSVGPSKWHEIWYTRKKTLRLLQIRFALALVVKWFLWSLNLQQVGFCNNCILTLGKILRDFHMLASGKWMPLWVQQHAYYWRLLHIPFPGMNCMQYCCSLLSSPTMSKLLRQKDVLFNRFYAFWMQKYHPTRVVTLTYQPFVLATTTIFTYHEAKVNTRLRNLAGYTLFLLSSFAAIIVSITDCTRTFLFE